MNTKTLLRLAHINKQCDMHGHYEASDQISNVLIKIAASWQSINTNVPMLERMWEWNIVDGDFNDAQRAREKHPRYVQDETMGITKGIIEFNCYSDNESLEKQLHPEEADSDDSGIAEMFYDGHSSLMQGEELGKKFKDIEKEKVFNKYKSLVPTFTGT